jgi:hypothetical protein
MMAKGDPLRSAAPRPARRHGAARRRRTDVLIAQIVMGVAAAASIGAITIAVLAPTLTERALEEARKAGPQATASSGAGLDHAVADQRIRDMQREVAAALEQVAIAAARARTAADEGRAVLREAQALIAGPVDGVVQTRTPEGDVFQGQAENGRPQGYGLVWRGAGGVFASFFIDGESRGAAAFCAQPDCRGAVYFGDYRHNQPTGFGEGVADGGTYRGEFKDGLPDGYGEYAYPGGAIYRGGFVAGQRQGFGVLTQPDKSIQAGYWIANQLRIPAEIPPPEAAPETPGNAPPG